VVRTSPPGSTPLGNRAGNPKLCDLWTLLHILDTFSHATLTDVTARIAGRVKIDQTKHDLTAIYAYRHLFSIFVSEMWGRQKFWLAICQNTPSGCVLGGWAWLTSVTLAVIGRPSA